MPKPAILRHPAAKEHLITLCLLAIMSMTFVSLSVSRESTVSILDEATHADNVYSITQWEIPRKGKYLSQTVLNEWSCFGFWSSDFNMPECGDAPYDPDDYPAGGYNYNHIHPPPYYVVDAGVSWAIRTFTPIDNFLTSTRLAGAFWLTVGTFAVWLLMLEMGISVGAARTSSALATILPAVIHLNSTVNNDGSALLVGSVVLLVTMRAMSNKLPLWSIPLVSFGAATFKTVFLVVGITAFFLVADEAFRRYRSGNEWKKLLLAGLLIPVAFGTVQYGWKAIQNYRTVDPEYVNALEGKSGIASDGPPIAALISEVGAFTPSSQLSVPIPETKSAIGDPWYRFSNVMLGAAPILLLFVAKKGSVNRRFAGATQLSLLVGATLVATTFWMNSGTYKTDLNPRYGLAILPAVLVCLGILADSNKTSRRCLAVAVAIGAALTAPAVGGWI